MKAEETVDTAVKVMLEPVSVALSLGLLNQTELAKEAGLSIATVSRAMNCLSGRHGAHIQTFRKMLRGLERFLDSHPEKAAAYRAARQEAGA
jgi:Trp operon repressor